MEKLSDFFLEIFRLTKISACISRPERLKGRKDEGPPARSWSTEEPEELLVSYIILFPKYVYKRKYSSPL